MGYRSSVHLGINNSAVKDWLTHLALYPKAFELVNQFASESIKADHGLYFEWSYIKWYSGYEDVDQINEFLDFLVEEGREDEFAFVRLGEEYGDWVHRGDSDHFEFHPTQSVSVWFENTEKENGLE